jgi:hypothetical protein
MPSLWATRPQAVVVGIFLERIKWKVFAEAGAFSYSYKETL